MAGIGRCVKCLWQCFCDEATYSFSAGMQTECCLSRNSGGLHFFPLALNFDCYLEKREAYVEDVCFP